MWMVNPKILCKNHILGEHKELHQCVGILNKKITEDCISKGSNYDLILIGSFYRKSSIWRTFVCHSNAYKLK